MLQNSVFLKLNYISLYSIRYTSPLSISGLWGCFCYSTCGGTDISPCPIFRMVLFRG